MIAIGFVMPEIEAQVLAWLEICQIRGLISGFEASLAQR
jgi:hypothetical protein